VMMKLDRDGCYRAVSSRDRRFDGVFFIAVRTTGIYCRPSYAQGVRRLLRAALSSGSAVFQHFPARRMPRRSIITQ
jgi:AraC family transcriptional regulator of adaptative response / DNA-3-methyladenine glycosylase II